MGLEIVMVYRLIYQVLCACARCRSVFRTFSYVFLTGEDSGNLPYATGKFGGGAAGVDGERSVRKGGESVGIQNVDKWSVCQPRVKKFIRLRMLTCSPSAQGPCDRW
jgi:hypothetical protein